MATKNSTAGEGKSKTQQAAEYSRSQGVTVYEAAKLFDVGSQSVYRYIKRMEDTSKPRCECCGQLLKNA